MGKGASKGCEEGVSGNGGEKKKAKNGRRVVLLGGSESGKSTFAKQMEVLFGKGFDDDTRWQHKSIIATNICEILKETLEGLHCDELDDVCPLPIEQVQQQTEAGLFEKRLSPDFIEMAKTLWNHEEMNKYFHKYTTMPQIMIYFMPKLDELGDQPPSDQDIITCRKLTTETSELSYEVDGLSVTLVDIGGQRGERKKWASVFNGGDIDVVLFFASLSGYDEVLAEDMKTNRLQESMNLYKEIINHKLLTNAKIVLVLNQVDQFQKKIKTTNLSTCCPDYKGPNDPEESLAFVKKKFANKYHGESMTSPRQHDSHQKKSPRPNAICHLDCENYVLVTSILDLTDIKKVAMAALNPEEFFAQEWSTAKPTESKKKKGKSS